MRRDKLIAAFTLTAFLAGCGGSTSKRKQQEYEVVQEGAASGVTSTIQGPGETLPPINDTNVDTTTAMTINPNAVASTTTPPPIAGTLPPPLPPPMTSVAPAQPPQRAPIPVTAPIPKERKPPEQTQTTEPEPPTNTDTATTTAAEEPAPENTDTATTTQPPPTQTDTVSPPR